MLILLSALQREFAAQAPSLETLKEALPMLGFPVDGQEPRDGDWVLDVDVTANRGDVMSHRGLARDLAARLGGALAAVEAAAPAEGGAGREIRLESEACLLYATAELRLGAGVTPGATCGFLASLGSTAKGLSAVDASNELLHRYGHPTHAFDADKVRGTVTVRPARAGERLVTLDGMERTLTTEDLVIADETGPIALAGVMGGEPTKVTESTTRVLLESAYFDPRTVRLMSRRHGLYSDASHRFGRGADPRMPRIARDLLVGRLQAWAGATVESLWTVGAEPDSKAAIRLPEALLNRIAGLPLPLAEAARGLRALGCDVEEEPSGLSVIAPSWRHDLAIPEDLAEEVLRLRGYEHLGSSLPPLDADPQPMDPQVLRAQSLARRMAHVGFHQTVTYGFVSPEADAEFATTPQEGRLLGNPLGQEYSVLRGSLLPSLRAAALHNLRQGEKEVRLFEIAPIYLASPEGPQARPTLGVVWGGSLEDRAPLGLDQAQPRPVHAADLVGLARSVGAPGTVVRDLGEGLLGLELGLDELPVPEERIIPEFGKAMRAFSRIPSAERDLSLLVDLGQDYAGLREAMVRAVPGALGGVLQSLRVVEIFRHKSLPPGKQAWLFRLSFRHPERTLTREEVDGWMAGVLEAAQALGAELRG